MNQPKLCGTTGLLRPGESAEVPVTAFFNESILGLIENINANARIIVEYRSLGKAKRAEIPLELPVYHRNAMSWDDDRRAASFVSPRDPAAQWFARSVSSVVQGRLRPGINRNIQYALGLFEILNLYGINYVIDPSSSYIELSESSSVPDSLNYPYQTLMYRGGDCDDLSILFCSLLEAVGIETAFITIPGHIYMAFDSGLTEDEARRQFYAPEELVYHEGRAWVPLEITIPGEGFYRAWRIGAKEWRDARGRDAAEIYPMSQSWTVHPPVNIPGAASRFSFPAEQTVTLAFDASMDAWIDYEIRSQVRALERRLAGREDAETRNALGVLYGRYGMLARAREQFEIAARSSYIHALVNLGNIAFTEQRYHDSLRHFQDVLRRDSNNSIATLGMSRSYYELNDFGSSDRYYGRLRQQDRGLAREYAYLVSFFETRGRAYSLADRLSTSPWSYPRREPSAVSGDADAAEPGLNTEIPGTGDLPAPAALPAAPEPPPAVLNTAPPVSPFENSAPEEPSFVPAAPEPPKSAPAVAEAVPEPPPESAPSAGAVVPERPAGALMPAAPPAEDEIDEEPETGGLSAMLSIGGTRLSSTVIPETPPVSAVPSESAPVGTVAPETPKPVPAAAAAVPEPPPVSAGPPESAPANATAPEPLESAPANVTAPEPLESSPAVAAAVPEPPPEGDPAVRGERSLFWKLFAALLTAAGALGAGLIALRNRNSKKKREKT